MGAAAATVAAESRLIVARDRDAYATIRGFVYQVDLTLERWLELGDGDALELEHGEDIDHVTRQLAGTDPLDWDRLLEQVKHRVGPITLRSESLRAAFANFHQHRQLNPGLRLRFRFSTNTTVGRERASRLPVGARGIEVWRRLYGLGRVNLDEIGEEVDALRAFVASDRVPQGVRPDRWREWRAFTADASAADFLAFVRSFEISTHHGDAQSLRPAIERRLIELGLANEAAHARALYNTLFTSIFLLLRNDGTKRVTKADLLSEVAGTGPGASDRVLAARLDAFSELVDRRLGDLERGLTQARVEVGQLRADVGTMATAIATHRVPPGAHVGDTRSFQLTATYFGSELSPASTFNHSRPLFGREALFDRALTEATNALNARGVVVLGGPGGVGKTRLLIALAEHLESNDVSAVRWVRDRVTPDADALNELPAGPVAIFCDDAHRRTDLASIFALADSRSEPTVVVLGTRPRGRDALQVAAFGAGIGWDQVHDLGDLADLDRDQLITLVRSELGPEDAQWAEAIADVTRRSTLVSLVAARLLRTRRVHPGVLAQDREARFVILGAFEEEAYGHLGADVDAVLSRRLLGVLAMIAPVSMSGDKLLTRMAQWLNTDVGELCRVVGVLQEAGVLREQRRGVRIVPDVLSDFILQRVLIAGGRPTGAEIVAVDRLGHAVLPGILRNAGELDWQLHAEGVGGRDAGVDVFSGVWDRFVERFRAAPNIERESLLESLRPVAGFQPAAVLELCEWLADHPEGDEATEWGIRHSSQSVLGKVPTLLAILAQHEAYFDRALDLLWRLGQRDARPLNPYPEHPMRQIQEVVEYAPRRYVWRQVRAIAALRRWTTDPAWSSHPHSPLVVASAVLQMAMVEHRFNRRDQAITMTRYGVNPQATRAAREAAIVLLSELVLRPDARGRVLATDVLIAALRPPDSQFGHVVTDQEENAFRAQYEASFAACERIAAESSDPLVRVKLRDGLQWAPRQTRLPWKRARATALVRRLAETTDMTRVRVWGRQFREAFTRPGQARQHFQRVGELGVELTRSVASQLIGQLVAIDDLLDYLVAEHQRFKGAGVFEEPGPLFAAIADIRSDIAVEIAAWMVSASPTDAAADFTPWLPILLAMIRASQPEAYELLLAAAAVSSRVNLRQAAAGALARLPEPPWHEFELVHARALLSDAEPSVRLSAINAFQFLSGETKRRMLASVVVGNDERVAAALADWWAYRPPGRSPRITRAEVLRILNEMRELPRLDAHQSNIDEMLAALARLYPVEVLEFVLQRARHESGIEDNLVGLELRYDAVPHGGLQGVWSALQATRHHGSIMRRLLEALAEEARRNVEPWRRGAAEIARRVMRWDSEVEAAIREWMAAGRCEDVGLLDVVFSKQPSLFVVEQRRFVTDLLVWAAACGNDTERRIRNALQLSTSSTVRARRHGEVSDVDVQLRDRAQAIADEIVRENRAPQVASLFREVADRAERRLAAEVERDAREIELEEAIDEWDDE